MPLPKVSTPTFEVNLISTGKAVKYRPFLVKEEKALLIALESSDEKAINNTLKDVLKACITSRGIKVDELPSFDLEYLSTFVPSLLVRLLNFWLLVPMMVKLRFL
jgi:hypothetical protein